MNRKKGYLLILLAAMIYSTTEVALKGLSGVFAPMQLTVERVLIGGAVLYPFAIRDLRRRDVHLNRRDYLYFAGLGSLTVLVHMSFFQMALLHMDASAASAIYSGNPIFTILFAYPILHSPIRRCHVTAIVLEVIGILFILNPANLEISRQGFAEIMVATICIALYSVLGKLRLARLGSLVITSMNFLVGGSEMLLLLLLGRLPAVAAVYERLGLGLFSGVSLTGGFTPHSSLALLYVGVVVVGLGFLLMLKVVEHTSAVESSFVFLLKPIFSAILAATVLREVISVNRIIGIAFFGAASLCIMGSMLKQGGDRHETDQRDTEGLSGGE